MRFLSKRKLLVVDKRPCVTVYESSSANPSCRNTASFPSLTIMSLYAKHSAAFIQLAATRRRRPAWEKRNGEEARDKEKRENQGQQRRTVKKNKRQGGGVPLLCRENRNHCFAQQEININVVLQEGQEKAQIFTLFFATIRTMSVLDIHWGCSVLKNIFGELKQIVQA